MNWSRDEDPIERESRRSAIVRRLISHGVRTKIITRLAGVSKSKQATLRRRLMVNYKARRRGPAKSSLELFLGSPKARAEAAALAAFFPQMKPAWTRSATLPGGDIPGRDLDAYVNELGARYSGIDRAYLIALVRRHGTRAVRILGNAATTANLGACFGHTLYAAEVDYLMTHEWAAEPDDVLWRRTKCGLHLSAAQRDAVAAYVRTRCRGP